MPRKIAMLNRTRTDVVEREAGFLVDTSYHRTPDVRVTQGLST